MRRYQSYYDLIPKNNSEKALRKAVMQHFSFSVYDT